MKKRLLLRNTTESGVLGPIEEIPANMESINRLFLKVWPGGPSNRAYENKIPVGYRSVGPGRRLGHTGAGGCVVPHIARRSVASAAGVSYAGAGTVFTPGHRGTAAGGLCAAARRGVSPAAGLRDCARVRATGPRQAPRPPTLR
jgi:hypothetical protein